MSDQTTPTPELEEANTAAEVVEETKPVKEVAAPPTRPSSPPPAPPVFSSDDDDDDDDDLDDDDRDDDDDDERFTAPAQYVEREGSGRPRRIGSDVRYDEIDYKNIGLLSRFLDRRGRILSRRKTRVSAKVQRKIVREIKRARELALLPYTADQTRIVRKRK
jgi:small subunit ribosomal protein S18